MAGSMDKKGKKHLIASVSSAQLKGLRHHQETQALQAYGRALQVRERSVSRLDDVLEDMHAMQGLIQRRIQNGASSTEVAHLRSQYRHLQAAHRKWQRLASQARDLARWAFEELLKARHASAMLEGHAAGDPASKRQESLLCFPIPGMPASSNRQPPLWN